jgi:hypothetical protein
LTKKQFFLWIYALKLTYIAIKHFTIFPVEDYWIQVRGERGKGMEGRGNEREGEWRERRRMEREGKRKRGEGKVAFPWL